MVEGKGAHYAMTYDSFGRCVSTEYYDTDDRPTNAGGFFRWTRTYTAYGWPAGENHYDTEGRYLGKIMWTYTPAGTIEKISHYDMNGEEIREYLRVPIITDVMQDNPAAEAGIKAGDILMQYGSWTFDLVLSDPENSQTLLQSETSKGRENEKRIAVLYDIVNPTNVGAIIRSAAALGMDGVMLTDGCADPFYRRAARVSMGTVFQIPLIKGDITIEKLNELGFTTVAMALNDDSISVSDNCLKEAEKIAVVLGSEGEGLPMQAISACTYTAKIPMYHGVDSLNVAAASAVAFYELCR